MKQDEPGFYEHVAQAYAETVDSKPIHQYYERPNTWSLLPQNLEGLAICDIGCGSGWYTQQLVKQGADVTAVDASEKLLNYAQTRIGSSATFLQADISKPLDMLDKASFDIIIAPLVVHYISNWNRLFSEFARILKPNGILTLSLPHPHMVYDLFELDSYFCKTVISDYWEGVGASVSFYHHTLHELSQTLYWSSFTIEMMLEPEPDSKLSEQQTLYDQMKSKPWFLFVRCRKQITLGVK